ncbi:MAG: hypothetical protein JO168_04160 [Solirubrobacterales bacterium]|nr:hypothetical protein [Solirubrobacterales bacterium]MBV9714083.1 hypothetical protein [Solirubrobacterales bacterium]
MPSRANPPRGFARARLVLAGYGWRAFFHAYRWPLVAALLLVGLAGSVAAVVVLATSRSSASSSGPALEGFGAALGAVPTNRVTGSGTVTVELRGTTATLTLNTYGLLDGSPHLAHIHGEGTGKCPTAASARLHNGHIAISTGDAIRLYGPTLVSLTEWGSTSGSVPNNIDLNRYPASGNIHYKRTIALDQLTADLIRDGDAVIVVHGIDYNGNHIYDFAALGVSDLDKTLPGEATAPALCGPLRRSPESQSTIAGNQHASPATTYVASLAPEPAALVPQTPSASGSSADTASPSQRAAQRFAFVCHLGDAAGWPTASATPAPFGTAAA